LHFYGSGMTRTDHSSGLAYAMAANLVWGTFPVYFKMLEHVGPALVIGYRMLWATVVLVIALFVLRQWYAVKAAFQSIGVLKLLLLSTVLMGISWGLYIWAVHSERIIETAMGYYLSPMMTVVVGLVMFKEHLNAWQWVAIAMAACGVLSMIVFSGYVPWIGIILGAAFALYSGIRKLVGVESLVGMCIETLLLCPLGLIVILVFAPSQSGALDVMTHLQLAGSGLITIVPIIWYVAAARRLSLTTLGTLFYLAPTISFFVGVFVYDEPFTKIHGVMFVLIWAGLVIYSLNAFTTARRLATEG